MKCIAAVSLTILTIALSAIAENPVLANTQQQSAQRVSALFPSIAIVGTPLNQEYMRIMNELISQNDPIIKDPIMPERIALIAVSSLLDGAGNASPKHWQPQGTMLDHPNQNAPIEGSLNLDQPAKKVRFHLRMSTKEAEDAYRAAKSANPNASETQLRNRAAEVGRKAAEAHAQAFSLEQISNELRYLNSVLYSR